ncbi:MAG: hypothetical protein D6766_04275 [Verrucomicrobia bacterium]|nr:MAG: hypothetical protein D6766_04275 [Verrucomicrobiota bacterium]
MPEITEGLPPLNELFNVIHQRPFSLLFANYSLLLGLAGGIAVIWAVNAWLGRRDTPGYRLALPMAVSFVIAGFMNVLAEVKQPGRLIYGYLYGWTYGDTAIIKYGIILLPLFLALCWWTMFQALDPAALERCVARLPRPLKALVSFMALWSWRYRLLDHPRLRAGILTAMILLGVFAASYSGIFLMNEHGVPIWNTPAQVLVFLFTGLAGGAALFVLGVPILHRLALGSWSRPDRRYHWIMLGCAVFALLVWYMWLWWINYFGDVENRRMATVLFGPFGEILAWQVLGVGLVVPILLLLIGGPRRPWATAVAGLGILWGAYAVRFVILIGGQALNHSGAGYLSFTPDHVVLWYTTVDAILALSLPALLALLLPLERGDGQADMGTEVRHSEGRIAS